MEGSSPKDCRILRRCQDEIWPLPTDPFLLLRKIFAVPNSEVELTEIRFQSATVSHPIVVLKYRLSPDGKKWLYMHPIAYQPYPDPTHLPPELLPILNKILLQFFLEIEESPNRKKLENALALDHLNIMGYIAHVIQQRLRPNLTQHEHLQSLQ
jgi:hypothetical protein